MSQQSVIKINYAGSGWRNILPYGWYTSKDNNVLLYCYKENSAIRSYIVDKITAKKPITNVYFIIPKSFNKFNNCCSIF